jgi:hypothetical protein
MEITVDGKSYQIKFRQSKGTGITICNFEVDDGEHPKQLFAGEVRCSHRDTFRSREGKKRALLRAMKDKAGMDKDARAEIWFLYLWNTKDPCTRRTPPYYTLAENFDDLPF